METIKVNMNPNPLDVQTIHASQNDSEARQWGFELHNNGDVIDSSEITDQIVFKAYKGGTEELLPSSLMNGSVDLGSLTWVLDNGAFRSTSGIPNMVQPQASVKGNIMCPMYRTTSQSAIYATANNMCISGLSYTNNVLVRNDSFTSASDFKNAMQGIMLWYETTDSTPTTTPINADIKYPQGLLTDQEFTYRESPTEEDGLAYVVGIKGQTLKWNQLVPIGGVSKSTEVAGVTVTDNRDGSYTFNGTSTAVSYLWLFTKQTIPSFVKPNHKYLMRSMSSNLSQIRMQFILYGQPSFGRDESMGHIVTMPSDISSYTDFGLVIQFINGITFTNEKLYPILIDVTEMGLDSLTDAEILQWFADYYPLPYYDYNAGTLLSFNGTGIKTVGKNLFDFSQFANGTTTFENGVLTGTAAQFNIAYGDVVNNGIDLKYPENTQITISFDAQTEQNASASGIGLYIYSSENGIPKNLARTMNDTDAIQHITVTIPSSRHIDKLGWSYGSDGANIWHITNFQVEFGTETSYEPYTESVINLPISTYFPNGMKSAGNVYDELTESKAITRIGSVDLGTLSWSYVSANRRFVAIISDAKSSSSLTVLENIVSAKYENATWESILTNAKDKIISLHYTSNNSYVAVIDNSYSDAPTFKSAMSGVMLYYELATESETSFTTASLVTENAEIPLSNEDGVLIGKCTEQLSNESGFFDAKIKLADGDGECYSNKIQLHVERSPQ